MSTTVSIDRLAAHARALAKEHRIILLEDKRVTDNDARTHVPSRTVALPPIESERVYATAMHEMGHLIHPDGLGEFRRSQMSVPREQRKRYAEAPIEMMIVEERAAWDWAKQHALIWTEPMQANEDSSLKTYTDEKHRQDAWNIFRGIINGDKRTVG